MAVEAFKGPIFDFFMEQIYLFQPSGQELKMLSKISNGLNVPFNIRAVLTVLKIPHSALGAFGARAASLRLLQYTHSPSLETHGNRYMLSNFQTFLLWTPIQRFARFGARACLTAT